MRDPSLESAGASRRPAIFLIAVAAPDNGPAINATSPPDAVTYASVFPSPDKAGAVPAITDMRRVATSTTAKLGGGSAVTGAAGVAGVAPAGAAAAGGGAGCGGTGFRSGLTVGTV